MNTLLEDIDALITDPEAIKVHLAWEEADARWKEAMKHGAPENEVLQLATVLRIARQRKDDVFDDLARKARDLEAVDGIVSPYNRDVLGKAKVIAEVEELSKEWHEMRRFGLGGSSLSEALGFHWKSFPGRIVMMSREEEDQHWADMAAQKLTPVTTVNEPDRGVLFRGHAWEKALIARYALIHGTKVAVSKATWSGDLEFQRINTDGIILDENNDPEGLLEIKTSSREWTWNHGVPLHYRIQVLWYLHTTGLKYADVVVKFDSGTVDTHRIQSDETLDGTDQTDRIEDYLDYLTERWAELEAYRTDVDRIWSDNERLRIERQDLIDSGIYDPKKKSINFELLDEAEVVLAHIASPYERMEKYERIHRVDIEDDVVPIRGVSPVFYPIPHYSDPEELDMTLPEGTIACVDQATLKHLTSRYGPDGLIGMSALRRIVEQLPGLGDFTSVAQCRAWIDHHLTIDGKRRES